jgi:hypothetical protein
MTDHRQSHQEERTMSDETAGGGGASPNSMTA